MDLSKVAEQVANYPSLTYRIEAQWFEGTFQVVRLILGAPPALWNSYAYDKVIFRAGSETGAAISTWLTERTVTLQDQCYALPIQSSASFQRRPSHTSYGGFFTISKPYTFYLVNSNNTISQSEVFADKDAPFFLSQQEAELSLLYDRDLTANDQLPSAGITLYLEQDAAWLEHIHFSSSALRITLGGTNFSDVKLKVTGTGIQNYDDYPGDKVISLPAPDGPPDIVKIALIKGNTWLDYFYDDRRHRYNSFAPRHTNVVFDYQEPAEEIARLIELGEGKTIEFKEAESDDKDKWKKTVVAFANTEGGYILFGVNDDGQVVGLNKDLAKHRTLEHFKDGLSDAISNTITPVPLFEFLPPVRIEEKDVLAIKVISDDQAHSLFFEKAHHFYIRRDATTRDANNFEIQELVRRKDIIRQGTQPKNSIFDLSSF